VGRHRSDLVGQGLPFGSNVLLLALHLLASTALYVPNSLDSGTWRGIFFFSLLLSSLALSDTKVYEP